MILTDREIQIAIFKEQIAILPPPEPECYTSTSVDLCLGERLTIFDKELNNTGLEYSIDPTRNFSAERELAKISKEITIDGETGFVLKPNIFILGKTREKIQLPTELRIAARVEGKSSLARFGLLIHFTAPTIHSGFSNTIRLEMINLGHVPIRLRSGMRICQIIFELTFGTPEKGFIAAQTS